MKNITDRQREALDFIRQFTADHGFPPTIREIATHMHIGSTNGVSDHLCALERKGYIVRSNKLSRSIRLVGAMSSPKPARLPSEALRGSIRAVLAQYNVLAATRDGRLETDLVGAIARRLERDGSWFPSELEEPQASVA